MKPSKTHLSGYHIRRAGNTIVTRSEVDFRGYSKWNWVIDENSNETRQALNDDSTLLCEETNNKVTFASSDNHDSDNTCTRQHD